MANPTVTAKANGVNTDDNTDVTSSSFSATDGDLLVVLVSHMGGNTLSSLSVTGITINGSWTIGPTTDQGTAGAGIAWAEYTSGTGTVTATFDGNNCGKTISVAAVSGYDTGTPVVSKTTDTKQSYSNQPLLTIAGPVDSENTVLAICAVDNYSGTLTPSQGSEMYDQTVGSDERSSSMYDDTSPGSVVDWGTIGETEGWAIAAIEIKAAGAPPSGIVPFRRRIEGY